MKIQLMQDGKIDIQKEKVLQTQFYPKNFYSWGPFFYNNDYKCYRYLSCIGKLGKGFNAQKI